MSHGLFLPGLSQIGNEEAETNGSENQEAISMDD
jgi:hypothetical protein